MHVNAAHSEITAMLLPGLQHLQLCLKKHCLQPARSLVIAFHCKFQMLPCLSALLSHHISNCESIEPRIVNANCFKTSVVLRQFESLAILMSVCQLLATFRVHAAFRLLGLKLTF